MEINFSHCVQFTGADEDTRLLWRLGYFINTNGCRRDFDLAITDMYLKGKMRYDHCETLRELIVDIDVAIPNGMVIPRLNEISKLILNKIKNKQNGNNP